MATLWIEADDALDWERLSLSGYFESLEAQTKRKIRAYISMVP